MKIIRQHILISLQEFREKSPIRISPRNSNFHYLIEVSREIQDHIVREVNVLFRFNWESYEIGKL